jgi:hypothetical protein
MSESTGGPGTYVFSRPSTPTAGSPQGTVTTRYQPCVGR